VIQKNISLKPYNTFGIDVFAKFFVRIESDSQVLELFSMEEFRSVPKLVLGGGSNILFTKDYDGMVVYINILGVEHHENGDNVKVTSGAGVIWDNLVQYCV